MSDLPRIHLLTPVVEHPEDLGCARFDFHVRVSRVSFSVDSPQRFLLRGDPMALYSNLHFGDVVLFRFDKELALCPSFQPLRLSTCVDNFVCNFSLIA